MESGMRLLGEPDPGGAVRLTHFAAEASLCDPWLAVGESFPEPFVSPTHPANHT